MALVMLGELTPIYALKYVLLSLVLLILGVYVDKWASRRNLGMNFAYIDSLVHFSLGAISWMMICDVIDLKLANELVLCGFLSSFIDIDHFLLAKSFRLKDALSLQHRPPLHCTTLLLLIIALIFTTGFICRREFVIKMGFIVSTAVFTHHLRDGLRRGLWMYPFGSTRPIPEVFYVLATLIFPLVCNRILYSVRDWLDVDRSHTKKIDFV